MLNDPYHKLVETKLKMLKRSSNARQDLHDRIEKLYSQNLKESGFSDAEAINLAQTYKPTNPFGRGNSSVSNYNLN